MTELDSAIAAISGQSVRTQATCASLLAGNSFFFAAMKAVFAFQDVLRAVLMDVRSQVRDSCRSLLTTALIVLVIEAFSSISQACVTQYLSPFLACFGCLGMGGKSKGLAVHRSLHAYVAWHWC